MEAIEINVDQMNVFMIQMEKSIFKIRVNEAFGTGFFCIIPSPDKFKYLPVMITTNHLLKEEDIIPGKTICIFLKNDQISKNILIDKGRKTYTNKEYDITIIEIKEHDGIDGDSFLEIDKEIFYENQINFNKIKVYLLSYGSYSNGIIKRLRDNGYTFEHLCSSQKGSGGGPIININNSKVIGFHIGTSTRSNFNIGTLLRKPIEDFNKRK